MKIEELIEILGYEFKLVKQYEQSKKIQKKTSRN